MNARQVADIARVGPKQRTRGQCALTHFDEAGAIVWIDGDDLIDAWNAHDWHALFAAHRDAWGKRIALTVVGHALFEYALEHGELPVAKVLAVCTRSSRAGPTPSSTSPTGSHRAGCFPIRRSSARCRSREFRGGIPIRRRRISSRGCRASGRSGPAASIPHPPTAASPRAETISKADRAARPIGAPIRRSVNDPGTFRESCGTFRCARVSSARRRPPPFGICGRAVADLSGV
jgi:hypothetical protein